MQREALTLALAVLKSLPGFRADIDDAIDVIKSALAQPAQERPWVGLTDEEIHGTLGYNDTREMYQFAFALIAKLKERNS